MKSFDARLRMRNRTFHSPVRSLATAEILFTFRLFIYLGLFTEGEIMVEIRLRRGEPEK